VAFIYRFDCIYNKRRNVCKCNLFITHFLFQNKIGPVIVSVNCNRHRPSYKVLVDPDNQLSYMMKHMIKESVSQHSETGHSQAIIVR
jgi:hypothetical protein